MPSTDPRKVVAIHCGGRQSMGPVGALFPLGVDLQLYVVEADLESAGWGRTVKVAREQVAEHGFHAEMVHACLDSRKRRRTFYVNKEPSSSSLFRISDHAQKYRRMSGNNRDVLRWSEACEVVEEREVLTTTLDDLVGEGALEQPDFLSMDIQGSEHGALVGAQKMLTSPRLIRVVSEVEFNPMYQGQPLYGDVDWELRRHGFFLATFLYVGQWYTAPICGRGFHTVVEALWLRRHEDMGNVQRMKLAYVAMAYDFKSYCWEILHDTLVEDHNWWERFLVDPDLRYNMKLGKALRSLDPEMQR